MENGTNIPGDKERADLALHVAKVLNKNDQATWRDILNSDVATAFAQDNEVILLHYLKAVSNTLNQWLHILEDKIDLAVEEWHTASEINSKKELHEHLGLTWEEYKEFF